MTFLNRADPPETATVADGKYTVINDNGKLTALRHGQPWARDLVGDNLVYWMFVEIQKLKQELAGAQALLSSSANLQVTAVGAQGQPEPEPELRSESKLNVRGASQEEIVAGELIEDHSGRKYRLILLPGDSGPAKFSQQLAWAQSVGGFLPTPTELEFLFERFRSQFCLSNYWSGQTYEDNPANAWCHNFGNGWQNIDHKGNRIRARAVRREYL